MENKIFNSWIKTQIPEYQLSRKRYERPPEPWQFKTSWRTLAFAAGIVLLIFGCGV